MIKVRNEFADIWLIENGCGNTTYCYGGTKSVPSKCPDETAQNILCYLGKYESGTKNKFINMVIQNGVFEKFRKRLPDDFYSSKVGGGRCVFRPKTEAIEKIINDPQNPDFQPIINSILHSIGDELNKKGGTLKLTPDFGRFSGVADLLHQYTEHVLGIRCEDGGCGGKASYTSTGINSAIDFFVNQKGLNQQIVLIGSNGSCGSGVLNYVCLKGYNIAGISDLKYKERHLNNIPVLASKPGVFTDECLLAGDIIVATTIGNEFLNSNLNCIRDNAVVLLAHNESLPINDASIQAIKALKNRGIVVVPGQLLTFGGALTSRIEWFWRLCNKGVYFDKQLAHESVYHMEQHMMNTYFNDNSVVHAFELIVNDSILCRKSNVRSRCYIYSRFNLNCLDKGCHRSKEARCKSIIDDSLYR